jgi:hypothetical protein
MTPPWCLCHSVLKPIMVHQEMMSICPSGHFAHLAWLSCSWLSTASFSLMLRLTLSLIPGSSLWVKHLPGLCFHAVDKSAGCTNGIRSGQISSSAYEHWPNSYDGQAQVRGWKKGRFHTWGHPVYSTDNVSCLLGHSHFECSLQISVKVMGLIHSRKSK